MSGFIVPDKYEMTQEENIFNAKRILVDSIYQQAKLEGIAVTYANTVDILNNVNIQDVTPKDISKVCCLRDGWKYLFDHINQPLDLIFLEDIHSIIGRFDVDYQYLGKIRKEDVMVTTGGGERWYPKLPDAEKIFRHLNQLSEKKEVTDRALETGLYIMRCQIFKDGNKRVGSFAINKILIENGKGIFNVPVQKDGAFKEKLVEFYKTNSSDEIKSWIYENCIEGIHPIEHAKDILKKEAGERIKRLSNIQGHEIEQ